MHILDRDIVPLAENEPQLPTVVLCLEQEQVWPSLVK